MRSNVHLAQENFHRVFPGSRTVSVFSAPGRTEICGNHTDHQNGCVLAAAVDLETIAVVSFNNTQTVRIFSEGFPGCEIDLMDNNAREEERGTTQSIVRGVSAGFKKRGVPIGGFDAYVSSNVPAGGGLSSSAAFEVLIGTVFNKHFNGGNLTDVEIAKIGQQAENAYFGKKSGLMDQMASSAGGMVFIDFKDCENPSVERQEHDFNKDGLSLFVTNTGGSHADLVADYVAIPAEMSSVAEQFGKTCLRAVNPQEFYENVSRLRKVCSDRAILRASHFFSENGRAAAASRSLKRNDIDEFLKTIRDSGTSSMKLLQNLYSPSTPGEQALSLAIMMSERVLDGEGAVRVHGGGFAGTVQAFVPADKVDEYRKVMDELFGEGSCMQLSIRNEGGVQVA